MTKYTTEQLWAMKRASDLQLGYDKPTYTKEESDKLKGKKKAIILPGNGIKEIETMWYPWMKANLEKKGIPTILTAFPDPDVAKEDIWKGFVVQCLGADEHTILIGHSSGAACTERLLADLHVHGAVIVSGCHTDLGDENEAASGYFARPWDWEKMKTGADWIIQIHSTDDHLVPFSEGKFVAEKINSEFHKLEGYGHCQADEIPELWAAVEKKL
eukprot:TRINITY_DN2954_c0_g1_i1.p1 TRINITY_DN2954_c0_g1~~TRINITY_DN2954_c0_g1_i1.p1  ORF type:complete len:215 (-),score=62.57 TRINITY_DN2954_c0_g1_i1:26-670(-)